jgi:hypothetical protein
VTECLGLFLGCCQDGFSLLVSLCHSLLVTGLGLGATCPVGLGHHAPGFSPGGLQPGLGLLPYFFKPVAEVQFFLFNHLEW